MRTVERDDAVNGMRISLFICGLLILYLLCYINRLFKVLFYCLIYFNIFFKSCFFEYFKGVHSSFSSVFVTVLLLPFFALCFFLLLRPFANKLPSQPLDPLFVFFIISYPLFLCSLLLFLSLFYFPLFSYYISSLVLCSPLVSLQFSFHSFYLYLANAIWRKIGGRK